MHLLLTVLAVVLAVCGAVLITAGVAALAGAPAGVITGGGWCLAGAAVAMRWADDFADDDEEG